MIRGELSQQFRPTQEARRGPLLDTHLPFQTVTVEMDVVSSVAFEALQELMAKANEIGKRAL